MEQQALDEIISVVVGFKDKQREIKQRLLSYFQQIRKHQQVALSNHYKILFQFISEVSSSQIHIQVLSQVHKHIDRDLIAPKDFKIVIQYFKSLTLLGKDKLYLKIAQLTLSMIDKIDKSQLPVLKEMIEVVSMMRLSPNTIQETASECTGQLVRHFQELSRSHNTVVMINFQFLVREVCEGLVQHNQIYGDAEMVYDEALVLEVVDGIVGVEDSLPKRNQELHVYIYDSVVKKHEQIDGQPSTRRLCLNVLVKMTLYLPSKLQNTVYLLLIYCKQSHRNNDYVFKLIRDIYSRHNLPTSVYPPVKQICNHIYNLLDNTENLTQQSNLVVASLSTLSQLLQSVPQSNLSGQDQLDQTRNILSWVNPSMKLLRKRLPSGAVLMAWTQLFHLMIKRAFHYRMQTNLVLKLTKYDHDLFVDTIEKYDSYFAEEQYWTVYHIIFRQGYHDIYDGPVDKLEMHVSGLKKVIIDAQTRNDQAEAQFAIKTVKSLLKRHKEEVGAVVRRVQEICGIIFDKGIVSVVQALLGMVEGFIRERENLEAWVGVLSCCQPQTLQSRSRMLQILSQLIQNYGQHLSQPCWHSLISTISTLSNQLNPQYLRQLLTILQTIIQQYLDLFSDQLVVKCLDSLVCYPVDTKNTKDKYKICGLLWTLGEKKAGLVMDRVAERLEQFCYDEVPEVAINGLCVYSELGSYQGYERLSKRLLKSGKESVIISYLHNYVKMVKRTLSKEIYYKINEFVVNNLPQLYELGLNEVIIESTICHHQLARLTVKQILADPQYFELSLYFFINFLSQKPKDLRLVRYSIPKMMVQLLSQLCFLSSFPQLPSTILFKDCLQLINRIVSYPALTNSAFNLEKNKIYFEDTEVEKYVEQFYLNLAESQEMMTSTLMKVAIGRKYMVGHTRFVSANRLEWMKRLGRPRDREEMKVYAGMFGDQEERGYVVAAGGEWAGFREYLSLVRLVDDKYYREVINKLDTSDKVDLNVFRLIYQDADDSPQTTIRKSLLSYSLFKWISRALRSPTQDSQLLKILEHLMVLTIHPNTFHIIRQHSKEELNTALLTGNRSHLVYLSSIIAQVGIQTDSKPVKEKISCLVAEVGKLLGLPIL